MELRNLTVILLLIGVSKSSSGFGSAETDRRSKISDSSNPYRDRKPIEIRDVYSKHPRATDELEEDHSREDKRKLDNSDIPHSRQKRLLWITNDGRLAFPPGTTLLITPTLALPFVRHPPEGFFSNISISIPLTIDFDKLGLTDNENPYGALPPIFSRSIGRAAGGMVADLVGKYLEMRRGKRDTEEDEEEEEQETPPHVQEKVNHLLHGGERAILFGVVEDFLANFGMEGKPCLLRAICEVHAHPLTNFGLVGEMIKLFFSASKSPYSDLLKEYVDAEKAGNGDKEGPGECWPYFKKCPKSLFLPSKNKYTRDAEKEHQEENNRSDEENSEYNQITLDKNFNDSNNLHAM